VPVREGPPQPAPPPKRGPSVRRHGGGWGIWTGIAAIAAIIFLGILLIVPGSDDGRNTPSSTVEKTTPAPNVTPKP
jgi:hypothetical protein